MNISFENFLNIIFQNNIVFYYFLGICPLLSFAGNVDSAIGMGIAVLFTTVITAPINWAIYQNILVPFDMQNYQLLVFILIIAAFVQFLEMIIEKFYPAYYDVFGIFLPLITVNCAILGVSIFSITKVNHFHEAVFFAFSSGTGYLFAMIIISGIKKNLIFSKPPEYIGNTGIVLIIAGIVSLFLSSVAGIR
ncbi:MAG: hypothetical protein HQM10_18280 [Candidatus Riflebacteria bacterium]|nr:hypothetical protein [Candidatus Riflebacteria bacterium]